MPTYMIVSKSGAVLGKTSPDPTDELYDDCVFIEGDLKNPSGHFYSFEEESFIKKSEINPTYTSRGLAASVFGIPANSVVSVNGASLTTEDDQPLAIEFDLPSTYQIEIEPPIQYLAETLEVTVGDA